MCLGVSLIDRWRTLPTGNTTDLFCIASEAGTFQESETSYSIHMWSFLGPARARQGRHFSFVRQDGRRALMVVDGYDTYTVCFFLL